MMAVEWFDMIHLQEICEHRLPPKIHVINHSGWIADLLRGIGLDHQVGTTKVRIFGDAPRGLELFDE